MADVAMPRLSDSMEEGTILKWLKSDGDEVKRGEELVEIETDKANMTYEADSDGTLKIVAQEGDTLAVGETIAQLGDGSGSDDEGGEEEPKAEEDTGEDEGKPRRTRTSKSPTRTRRGGRRRGAAARSPPRRARTPATTTTTPPATASARRRPTRRPRRPRRRPATATGTG